MRWTFATGLALAMIALTGPVHAGGEPPTNATATADASFELADATVQFPTRERTEWPGEWASAKAYLFNMESGYGPGSTLFAWKDGTWHPRLEGEAALSDEMAAAALELVHRAQGELLMSKCPFPRHAVVFFDADGEPLGSVNVCFECTDILVWPPYYGDGEEAEAAEEAKFSMSRKATLADKKRKKADPDWEPERLIVLVNEAVLADWSRFFSTFGWPLEPSKAKTPSREP